MCIRLLEIIRAVQWVEPCIQEKFTPVPSPEDKAPLRQSLLILSDHHINVLALQVRERLDDTIGRYNGLVLDHHAFEYFRVHDVGFDCEVWVHN